ncbi:MAG: hypothetical protein P8Y70_06485, partial [Candidatus Lokiarchaeota archaeon]
MSFVYAEQSSDNFKLKLNVDYGRFRYDSSSVYVEVYYTVFCDKVKFDKSMNNEAQAKLDFTVFNSDQDSILAKDKLPVKFTKSDVESELTGQGAMGMVKLVLDPGKYIISLSYGEDEVKWIDCNKNSYLRLYEGRMIWLYDHRLNSINFAEKGKKRKAISTNTNTEEYQNPYYYVEPNYWIKEQEIEK